MSITCTRRQRFQRPAPPVPRGDELLPHERLPRNASRDTITDAHRVYPGDGVAPLKQILRDLFATGFSGAHHSNYSTARTGNKTR